ncbi:MAG: squalene/phytoene synthase family protein, partial [Acidimicrobiaceae bacterium]|nr:squalene/phytoene synthase family protein [Acidimicrobiaceae bacterium]
MDAPLAVVPRPDGLPTDEAVLGRMAGENFPVALRILPARTRTNLIAIYGFARLTDEIGDNSAESPPRREAALDWLEGELDRALWDPDRSDLHPLVTAAAVMVRRLGIDPQPLRDLIEANRLDQRQHRYQTFDDLLGYCRLSANPVGRLVLAAFEASSPQRATWSDSICTGLQLVEHWQDVREDAAAGRIYLPQEDLARFEVAETDLGSPTACPRLKALLV